MMSGESLFNRNAGYLEIRLVLVVLLDDFIEYL